MADINLLQTQVKDTTQTSTTRTKLVVWLGLVVLILIAGGCGILYFMAQSVDKQIADIDKSNTLLQSQIDSQEGSLRGAKAYQAKLSNIALLLKDHIYLTNLFNELEQFTYLKAQYNSFDLNQENGRIHVEGVVDSYNGLGKLLLGLEKSNYFQNVRLVTVIPSTAGSAGYQFSIDMVASPAVFNRK